MLHRLPSQPYQSDPPRTAANAHSLFPVQNCRTMAGPVRRPLYPFSTFVMFPNLFGSLSFPWSRRTKLKVVAPASYSQTKNRPRNRPGNLEGCTAAQIFIKPQCNAILLSQFDSFRAIVLEPKCVSEGTHGALLTVEEGRRVIHQHQL